MRDDRGVLAERWLRTAVPVREQLAEFIDRVDRIKTNDVRVRAHPRSRVNAARPVFQVAPLERLELLAFDPRLGGDLIQRDTVSLTVPAKASDETFLRGHLSLHGTGGDPSNYRACRVGDGGRTLGLQHP